MNYRLGYLVSSDTRDWILEAIHQSYTPAHHNEENHEILQRITSGMQPDFPPVVNFIKQVGASQQQGNAGSSTAIVLSRMMRHWFQKDNIVFSPSFIYRFRKNYANEGMYIRDGMRILRDVGCCSEDNFPYKDSDIEPRLLGREAQLEATRFRIDGFAFVKTIQGVKRALLAYGPVLLSVPVYNYGSRMWVPHKENARCLGHQALLLIGYSHEGFIVQNSWGKEWGDEGCTIFPYCDFGMHDDIVTFIDVVNQRPISRKLNIPSRLSNVKKRKRGSLPILKRIRSFDK